MSSHASKNFKPDPAVSFDIEKLTKENFNFRKVIHTSTNQQIVLMCIAPGQDIGLETHEDTDQFIKIEDGKGLVLLNNTLPFDEVESGYAVMVSRGTLHNIINTSKFKFMKLYTIYSPPHHKPGLVQKFKPVESI